MAYDIRDIFEYYRRNLRQVVQPRHRSILPKFAGCLLFPESRTGNRKSRNPYKRIERTPIDITDDQIWYLKAIRKTKL